jgi:hypothetical protein
MIPPITDILRTNVRAVDNSHYLRVPMRPVWSTGWSHGQSGSVEIGEFDDLATSLPGVRRRSERGLFRWQCRGRLLARQLDDLSVVIRVPFDVRDFLVQQAVTSAWRLRTASTSSRR